MGDLPNEGDIEVRVKDPNSNYAAGVTFDGKLKILSPPFTKFSDSFVDNTLDTTNKWSATIVGSGTRSISNCIVTLGVGIYNGDESSLKTTQRFFNVDTFAPLIFRARLNFGGTGHNNNRREFYASNISETEAFGFRLQGTQFSVFIRKNGVETSTNISFVWDVNWHLYEIRVYGSHKVEFIIDGVLWHSVSSGSDVLVYDTQLGLGVTIKNVGSLPVSGLEIKISSVSVSDDAGSGVATRLSARDENYNFRELLSDKGGRLVVVYPGVSGGFNVLEFPSTSIGPYVANLWRKVLSYSIPAGFVFNPLFFYAVSATANYPTRLTQEMYFGAYNIGNGVFSDGNAWGLLEPQYSSSLEVEVTTAIGGNVTLTITYTNQSGVTGRTGTVALSNGDVVGTKRLVTLQSGDFGVKDVTAVTRNASVTGAVNVVGITEISYIHNTTASVPLQNNLPSGIYIPGGVGGRVNIEITASSTTAAIRRAVCGFIMFLKTQYPI